MNDDKIVYFILGGFILLGILGIFALPAISDIPPTPAFSSINGTGGSINATNYRTTLELIEGSNIIYSFDDLNKQLTISAAGGGGINNTISSIGTQQSIVSGQVLNDHQLKGLACGGDLQCSNNSTDVTISFIETGIGSVALDDLTDVVITSPAYLSTLFYTGANWIDKIFSANSFDVNCSDTQQINRLQYDNQTGITTGTCETDETGSGGTPRGGYLMAHWSMSQTKSNIGTSFVNVYPQTNSNGKAILIDTDTFTTVRLQVQWNKVGSGTQTCQIINGATVLVSTDVISGSNDSGFDAIPAGLLNAENSFIIQCKSTTGTDDPIFENAAIWMK